MSSRTFEAQTPLEALLLEQALVMAQQIERAAAAPDGQVLARLEAVAVPASREMARRAVEAAAQAQAPGAEKTTTR